MSFEARDDLRHIAELRTQFTALLEAAPLPFLARSRVPANAVTWVA
jgi:hypothetical protein